MSKLELLQTNKKAHLPRFVAQLHQHETRKQRENEMKTNWEKTFQTKVFKNGCLFWPANLCLQSSVTGKLWTHKCLETKLPTDLIVIIRVCLIAQVFVSWGVTAVKHGFRVGPIFLDLALKVCCSSLSVLGVRFTLKNGRQKCSSETWEQWCSIFRDRQKRWQTSNKESGNLSEKEHVTFFFKLNFRLQ